MKLKKRIKNAIRDVIRAILPKKIYIKIRFLLTHGYLCNLKIPKTWNEKIQYRKLNTSPTRFSSYVDKLAVRKYVIKTIGEEYLIPLIGQYRAITASDIEGLPNAFAIKTSNGGGGENVKIIRDKNLIDTEKLASEFNEYIKIKIGSKIDEPFYDVETPHILVEELMLDDADKVPSDYKIHIFQGDPSEQVIIQIDSDRFGNHKRSIYDESLNKLDYDIKPKYDSIDESYVFPENIHKLLELAKQLAKPFPYVRVDMYSIKSKVYFGEMTFCHGSGWENMSSKEADLLLGSYWKEYDF